MLRDSLALAVHLPCARTVFQARHVCEPVYPSQKHLRSGGLYYHLSFADEETEHRLNAFPKNTNLMSGEASTKVVSLTHSEPSETLQDLPI